MHLNGRFWIELAERPVVGHGRIELLERIRDSGSIREAAKSMKMGYKAAWDAVDAINHAALEPVVIRTVGGKSGGGTQLTPRGQALIDIYRAMEREHAAFLASLGERYLAVLRQTAENSSPE